MDKDLFHEILISSNRNKLVFFVGAGVSAISKYPTWKELIDEFYKELYGNTKESYSDEEYLKIPQIYYNSVNDDPSKYYSKVKGVFDKKISTNIVHDYIMMTNPKHILTTNYDTLIEEAAIKFGKNYSIINADIKVSSANSDNYILKVHGDFEHNNFVLKEDDYLNYDNQFKLIDIMMKTVMANNLVVFIGYRLGDYNIKLILNWVKQVQGETFVKPIFIYTGQKKLDEYSIRYYESRGLRIIDSNNYIESQEYEPKYLAVLQKITQYKESNYLESIEDILDYLDYKLGLLNDIAYIRRKDFKQIFDDDYYVDERGAINRAKDIGVDYINKYFSIDEQEISDIEARNTLCRLNSIFDKFRIRIPSKKNEYGITYDYLVDDDVLQNNYLNIEEYVDKTYESVSENYIKAYYLYILGNVEESYNLYTDLLLQTKESNNWLYYYFCQLNRNYVYKTTVAINRFFTGISGILYFGKEIKIISNDYLEKINREMLNIKSDRLFDELPYEFKERMPFLKRLSSGNYYSQDFVDLLDEKNILEKRKNKSNIEFGISKLEKIKTNATDTINFTYKNKLLFSSFDEHKKYVKNFLILYFENAYDQIVSSNEFDKYNIFRPQEFQINYYDYINVVKNFKLEDIEYLESVVDLNVFQYPDEIEISQYIIRTMEYYKENFSNQISGYKIIMYMKMKEEMKNILYFSKYFINDIGLLNSIIDFLLNFMPEREVDSGKKFSWAYRLLNKKNVNYKTLLLLEEYLIKHVNVLAEDSSELSSNGRFTHDFVYIINQIQSDFVSEILSAIVLDKENNKEQISFFVSICSILSNEAKTKLSEVYDIDTFNKLKTAFNNGLIDDLSQYEDIIIKYLDDELEWQEANDKAKQKVLTGSGRDITQISAWALFDYLNIDSSLKKYLDLNDEFHFMVEFETFDIEKFDVDWLLKYSPELIKNLSKNDKRKRFMICQLDDKISAAYNNRLTHYYEIYKNLSNESIS